MPAGVPPSPVMPGYGTPGGQGGYAPGGPGGYAPGGPGGYAPGGPGGYAPAGQGGYAPGGPGSYAPGGYSPGYGAGGYGGAAYPRTGGMSGWAVASFILGILGSGILLSYVCGGIALSRIRRLGQRGRGLAITGMILSTLWIGLVILGAVLNPQATRSPTGKITSKGTLGVFSLRTGDCFDNPASLHQISQVSAIPCGQPHDAQIFATFSLAANLSYPGTAGLDARARSGCNARSGSLDKAKITSAMSLRFIYPDQNAWTDGHRGISCLILNPTRTLTSSVLKPGAGG